jgi:hypothetical protein
MKEKDDYLNPEIQKGDENIALPGYPIYPPDEDIYTKCKQQYNMDPDDILKLRELNDLLGAFNETDFDDDVSGSKLDVPGSELDDDQENIGSEDEDNNYYSLGGDNHNDLDEYTGD